MPACSAFFKHLSENSKLFSSLGSNLFRFRIRRSSKGGSSFPSDSGGLPIPAKKIETTIESKEIVECMYIPGKGYVPVKGNKGNEYERKHQVKCFAGESDLLV